MPDYSTHIVAVIVVGFFLMQNYVFVALIAGGVFPDLARKVIYSNKFHNPVFAVVFLFLGAVNSIFFFFGTGIAVHIALDWWKKRRNKK